MSVATPLGVPQGGPVVAVLIATCNRPSLLAQRALTAVQQQTRPPEYLVVVDDSDTTRQLENRNVVNDLRLRGARICYLRNVRTPGAAGAWNTGLDWLRRHCDPRSTFVAILDDDDEWGPEHLATCAGTAIAKGLDMVAAGIERRAGGEAQLQAPPTKLDAGLFLVGNPHIQGSNLFVRLNALLAAGTFDEFLPSCTDRDLCIRLADLGWVRYAAVESVTVIHYADGVRARLSSPTGDSKKRGLDRFWWKWHGRMSEEQRTACLRRARELFDWVPPTEPEAPPDPAGPLVPAKEPTEAERKHADDLVFVVGVIADDDHAGQVARLLEDLVQLQLFDQICCLDVVVLDNGRTTGALARLVADFRARGLSVLMASRERQAEDACNGFFGAGFPVPEGRMPIGPARTMLQAYVARVARRRPGAIAWILDDDSRLDNLSDGGKAPPFSDLLASLTKMRANGVDVVLGTVTGDPPIPPGSTVRTQLVDLYHNLSWLSRLPPDAELPDRRAENRRARAAARDYYYDLSRRDTHHLEWPFWLTPVRAGERVADAFERMIAHLPRILAGQGVFRPLVLDEPVHTFESMRPSVQRGTNSFVFEPEAFSEFPNAAPVFAGDVLRRSDMIWALLSRYAGGRRIVSARLPIRHDRSDEAPVGLDLVRLIPDIRGYALYSALEDVLVRRRERRLRQGIGAEVPDDLHFRDGDLDLGSARFRKYLTERTAALLLSCWRIQGLCDAVTRTVERRAFDARLFASEEQRRRVLGDLHEFIERTRSCFAVERVEEVVAGILDVPDADVRQFFDGLQGLVSMHRAAKTPGASADPWFDAERIAAARPLASAAAGGRELGVLGIGGEGVVFATDTTAIKVIDYSKRSAANGARRGLERLVSTEASLGAMYRPTLALAPSGRQVICHPFEQGEPYRGGRTAEIVQILRDCRAAGIVTTNFHPKNLVVTAEGVRLIDYGSDLRPWTEGGFRSMVQRAWLSMRFHDREDLSARMRAALDDEHLPELEGWESLLAAIDPPTKEELVDNTLVEVVASWAPKRVLDFGCGRGRVAAALAGAGTEVVAFDPDASLREWWERAPVPPGVTVRWLTGAAEHALAGLEESFDAALCSLVLCVIDDDLEYQAAIRRVARALSADGRFALLVCNPDATTRGDSTVQRRLVPEGADVSTSFPWIKILPSGSQRRDMHRPLSRLLGDLAAFDLLVERATTTGGLGLDGLCPHEDFLLLMGRKRKGDPRPLGTRPPRGISRPRRPASVPVLCYHRVLPRGYEDAVSTCQRRRGTVVDADVFRRHLEDIVKLFRPIQLDAYLEWLDGIRELPDNACLITFDDGYRDFAEHALPELAARAVPSALFATASSARGEDLLPVDRLYAALGAAERAGRLDGEQLRDWTSGTKKKQYLRAPSGEQFRLLREAGLELGSAAPADLYLSESELVGLPRELVALGGHGRRHELLVGRDLVALRAEVGSVKRWIEELTASRPPAGLALAYPNGAYDSATIAAVIEAGFSAAFSVEPWRATNHEHRWRLRRACVPNVGRAICDLAAGKELRI